MKEGAIKPRMRSLLSRRLLPATFLLGAISLAFIAGAAVVVFQLPPADFMRKSFLGAEAWFERDRLSTHPTGRPDVHLSLGDFGKNAAHAFPGFTVYTTWSAAEAVLIDMAGNVVHKWSAPFSSVWPTADHVRNRGKHDVNIYAFAFHLYENGDLLLVYQCYDDTPYGYGLAKVNKDSKVIWKYSAKVHHAVDVGEDGRIYTLTHEIINEAPPKLENTRPPCLVDYLVVLSADGKEQAKLSILEALHNSPYGLLLAPRRPKKDWDILHTNCVKVLDKKTASRFPRFRPGQVLVSIRELDMLAVVDITKGAVVWAVRGPWEGQHDPQFLENGRLLIFDNLGSAKQARLLEYDPETQAFPWSYSRADGFFFKSPAAPHGLALRGTCQRLPNGNTLILNAWAGELLEITRDKQPVWSCSCRDHVTSARRYGANEVSFVTYRPTPYRP